MEVTQELVVSTFPHGIQAAHEVADEAYSLVDPEVRESGDGRVMLKMWGMAGKAFYYDVTDPEELAPDRWRVKTLDGQSAIFNPLREHQAESVHADLENY